MILFRNLAKWWSEVWGRRHHRWLEHPPPVSPALSVLPSQGESVQLAVPRGASLCHLSFGGKDGAGWEKWGEDSHAESGEQSSLSLVCSWSFHMTFLNPGVAPCEVLVCTPFLPPSSPSHVASQLHSASHTPSKRAQRDTREGVTWCAELCCTAVDFSLHAWPARGIISCHSTTGYNAAQCTTMRQDNE